MGALHAVVDLASAELAEAAGALLRWLTTAGHDVRPTAPAALAAGTGPVLVLTDRPPTDDVASALLDAMTSGRGVLLLGPSLDAMRDCTALTEQVGVITGAVLPVHETRLRPAGEGTLSARWAGDLVVTDRWPLVDKVLDDVDVLITANHHLVDHPVAMLRGTGGCVGVLTPGSTATTLRDPAYAVVVHRLLRALTGISDRASVGVGLLGYGAIGHEHNAAIAAVDGLHLAAVCDRNPARVDAARTLSPAVREAGSGDELLAADDVDLIIVSTPPNTHAEWALRALEAGKHVVVEKPFCITVDEADAMIAAAAQADRALAVYQNRRWDSDYLALKAALRSGAIGEVFHLESFIGGYAHPCNYWHSDEGVSGGAIYDWGSHYIDWILDLLPQPVESVSATTHKRVWHDVSNADHSRVLIRFADGVEAEFVHSDIAAALKPKWLVLGTEGAVRGDWRTTSVIARDAVGNLAEDRLAESEAPAALTICRPAGDGAVSTETLALLPAPAQPFHRELAEHLHTGAPMSVTPAGSRRNIAVMEAATRSAADGGRPVTVPG